MEEFNIEGRYLDGVKKVDYNFTGKLIFDNESFVGFVNDERCPAEILQGRVHRGFWKFLKKYRSDESILEHPFFKGLNFSEPKLGGYTCDYLQGIPYYGRTVGSEKTSDTMTSVAGVYDSLIFKEGYDLQEKEVSKLVHAEPEEIARLIRQIKDGITDSVGIWRMNISHSNGVPSQFLQIPAVDIKAYLAHPHLAKKRIPVRLRERAFFDL